MKLTVLFLFILGAQLSRAAGNDADGAVTILDPSPTTAPLVPVNPVTRFVLADALPHLAESVLGSMQDTVVLRVGEYRQEDDQTIVTQQPQAQGKQSAWVQMNNYWIEPVTPPPSQGEPLIVPIDDMRVAEVQGEVTLLESVVEGQKKPKPLAVNEDMEVPNDATLVSADTGSSAVMVGGHTSVRLVPHSVVQFHYDTAGLTPRVEIHLLQGAIFCKVGKLADGRVADVAVCGPVGQVAVMGSSDFFVQADPVSIHVCLAQGKLLLGDGIPLAVGNMSWYTPDVSATSASAMQIRHFPAPASGEDRARLDAQVLRLALQQAAALNVKIKMLVSAPREPMSSDDQAYLAQIPRVTWYARATAPSPN